MTLLSGGTPIVEVPAALAPPTPVDPVPAAPAPSPTEPVAAPAPAFNPEEVASQWLQSTHNLSIAEINELKNRPQFANELVAQVNQFVAAGEPISKVQNFLQIQSLDIPSLDAKGAIVQQMKMQYPELSVSDIESHIAAKYGTGEDENRVALTIDAGTAKNWLAEQKVKITPPQPQVQTPQGPSPEEIARMEVQKQQWLQVSATVTPTNIPVALDIPDVGPYTFDIVVDPAIANQLTQHVIAANMNSALTPESLQNVKQTVTDLYVAQNWKSIVTAIIADTVSSVKGTTLQQLSGPPPVPVAPGAPPAAPAKRVALSE